MLLFSEDLSYFLMSSLDTSITVPKGSQSARWDFLLVWTVHPTRVVMPPCLLHLAIPVLKATEPSDMLFNKTIAELFYIIPAESIRYLDIVKASKCEFLLIHPQDHLNYRYNLVKGTTPPFMHNLLLMFPPSAFQLSPPSSNKYAPVHTSF